MTDRVYSARQAAPLIGATERTVRRWVDNGLIEATRLNGGSFRISHAALAKRAAELGRPLNVNGRAVDPSTGEVLEATAAATPAPARVAQVAPPVPVTTTATTTTTTVGREGELRGILGSIRACVELATLDDKQFREVVRAVLTGREALA